MSVSRFARPGTVILAIATTFIVALSLAAPSLADPTADLTSSVQSARGRCPSLQEDPALDEAAQRATRETDANIQHEAKFLPFEDAMPVLREMGYPTSKAKLLAGYGTEPAKAIRGAVLQGWEALPDCSYVKYGANALTNDSQGYVLTAVVLAGA